MTPAPDVTYRGKDYRLEAFEREQGASVRYGAEPTCNRCPRLIGPAVRAVRLSDRLTWLHTTCAIQWGVLVEQPRAFAAERQTVGAR